MRNKINLRPFRRCLPPFQDYKSSGPFLEEREGRLVMFLCKGKARKLTYARYVFCASIGREVLPGYEVDHKDGNRRNDLLSNLQEILAQENKRKANLDKPILRVRLWCPSCQKDFIKPWKSSCLNPANKKSLSFCSLACSRNRYALVGCEQKYELLDIKESARAPDASEPWEHWSVELDASESTPYLNTWRHVKRSCSVCRGAFTPGTKWQSTCSAECRGAARHRKLSDSTVKELLKAILEDGAPWSTVAKQAGISASALKNRAKRMGYSIPLRCAPRVC